MDTLTSVTYGYIHGYPCMWICTVYRAHNLFWSPRVRVSVQLAVPCAVCVHEHDMIEQVLGL
jgi:hypothetical protein